MLTARVPAVLLEDEIEVPSIEQVENDTSPLTILTVSKKHIRVLLVLIKVEDELGKKYVPVENIRDTIAMMTRKSYPFWDIRSFADDLEKRSYVKSVFVEGADRCYQITSHGANFLFSFAESNPKYFKESRSPNVPLSVH